MNPWLSIWRHPRQTIRQIVETRPGGAVPLVLMMTATVAKFSIQLIPIAQRMGWSVPITVFLSFVCGAMVGLVLYYLFGWLYQWVGSWLGGQAKNAEVRTAIAWVEVPTLALTMLVLPLLFLSPMAAAILLMVAGFVVWIWQTVLACHTLGEVHRFSAWKGFGTLLIPNALIAIDRKSVV